MRSNENLHKSKRDINDEFNATIADISAEMDNYADKFRERTVFCNCDDYLSSNFVRWFDANFERLGIKELIAAGFSVNGNPPTVFRRGASGTSLSIMHGDERYVAGDFRSDESIELLRRSDIVVTNPPFSLFKEYFHLLITGSGSSSSGTRFIVLGNENAYITREMFPYFQRGDCWLGCTRGVKTYEVPPVYADLVPDKCFESGGKWYRKFGNHCWFTNIDHGKRHKPLETGAEYSEPKYPKYDNFNAINVDSIREIPNNYSGIMGVPISLAEIICREQFEIVWQASGNSRVGCPKETMEILGYKPRREDRGGCGLVDGRRKFTRLFVRYTDEYINAHQERVWS